MRSDVSREGLNPVDTAGKTRTSVIPAPAVEETRVQTSECQRLSRLVADLIRVSEGLCYARLKGSGTQAPYVAKKTFGTSFDAEIQAEGEVLSGPGLLHELGLEALEGAVHWMRRHDSWSGTSMPTVQITAVRTYPARTVSRRAMDLANNSANL